MRGTQVFFRVFSIFLGLLTYVNSFSQGNIGDDLFDNFEYQEAIKYYEQDGGLTLNQKENLAYSYYMTFDYVKSEKLYQEIVNTEDVEPVFYQFYAVSLKNIGNYEQAKVYFEKALASDSSLIESKYGLASLEKLPELLNREEKLEVYHPSGLNSGTSSYSPKWYQNGILYCAEMVADSLKRRPKVDIDDDFNGSENLVYGYAERPVSAIYYSEVVGNETKITQSFAFDEKFHIGDFCLTDSLIYFTRVDLINKWDPNVRNHPRLYQATVRNGVLADVKKVNIKSLSNEVGSGHPCLSSDGKTLFFSSDMPGGYGGSDLYKTVQDEKGNWGKPENLGANINTDGDELFPSIQGEDFYFSSNGRPGYGGMDLFKVELANLSSASVELLSAPLNSSGDDLSVLFDPSNSMNGFVVSHRGAGMGDDDIYGFREKLDGIFVQGIVRDMDGNPVANALVKIYDENGNEVAQVKTDENGKYIMELDEVGDYEVVATIPGYGDKKQAHVDENWDNHQLLDMVLEPTMTAQGIVKNEDGTPASNVDIKLLDENGNVIYAGKTDENGYYQFPLEDDQTYTALASDGVKNGSETFTTDSNYDPLEDTDIVLKSGTFVEGIVLDKDGNPTSGVEVNLYDDQGNLVATTITDENGNYHFDLENDKDYQIVATTDGYEGVENIYTGDNYDENDKLNLNLEPVGKESFALVEDKSNNEGIENVVVTLIDNETGKKITTRTDKDGKFTVNIKPNHNYTINLDKDGYYPKSVKIEAGKKLPEKVDLNQMGDFGMDYAGYNVKKIYFELDEYSLTAESKEQLDKLVLLLKNEKQAVITIKSYADCRGTDKYNKSLTWKRSKSVKKYLTDNGIKAGRILTESLGATNFVNNCTSDEACSESEHALNRRSEFEIDFKN